MDFNQISKVRKLYKTILKLHNGLPDHLKSIGNYYARDEFKRHKNCNSQLEAVFIEEWTKYAILLSQQLGLKGPKSGSKLGRNLTRAELDSMSDVQIEKLYEIMTTAQGNESHSYTYEEKNELQ